MADSHSPQGNSPAPQQPVAGAGAAQPRPEPKKQLTPAQQQMLRKLIDMTPEQREELRSKAAGMQPQQRAAAEEALRLYAAWQHAQQKQRMVATQQLERAALQRAVQGTQELPSAAQQGAPQTAVGKEPGAKAEGEKTTVFKASAAKERRAPKQKGKQWETWKQRFLQATESLQRGANDAALAQAREAAVLPAQLVYNALGQLLYFIGLQTEYGLLRFWRALRRVMRLGGQGFAALLAAVWRPVRALSRGIWRDLTEPLVRLFSGFGNMARVMKQAAREGDNPLQAGGRYLKSGVQTYRKALWSALSYLLPVAAACVFGLTVWSVLRNEYSLAVTYNGQMLGFVANESVWEEAQRQVRSRLRAADGVEFNAYPEFNVQSINTAARTTAYGMADKIVEASSDQIKKATGLLVNGTLVGVCEDGKGLRRILDNALSLGYEETDTTVRTEFINDIETVAGVYLTQTVVPLAQIESDLVANNWLQIKVLRTETYEEDVKYQVIEQESDKYYKGTRRIQQAGKNGRRQVTADVATIDGVEVSRTELDSVTLVEATPQIVLVGTKDPSGIYSGSITPGTGVMVWPVPNFSYLTTRFGQGGHRGLDICAPYGTPIYACDGGTVVEAGRHWSWGNYIRINHGNGFETLYAHNSALLVGVGSVVGRGQLIAEMGSTGNSSGNHLHLEIYFNGRLVNPLSYVG